MGEWLGKWLPQKSRIGFSSASSSSWTYVWRSIAHLGPEPTTEQKLTAFRQSVRPLRLALRQRGAGICCAPGEEASLSTTSIDDSIYGHLLGFGADQAMEAGVWVTLERLEV